MRRKLTLLKVGFIISAILFSNVLFAQNQLTGTVKDENGKPLVGVTIFVRGTKVATASDANGNFKVTVPKNHPVLVASSVGYEPQEISVSDLSEIAITMRTTVSTLNTVVVTGYGTQKKKDISGSVAVVDVGDAKKIPATSTEQLLQGQAAGVTVLNSGQPGGASTVFVRGISNFGQTQPLYVVDGVQVGDMSNVNPNDIESISVLKDAGAAAIYGIAGGNGVVVITTKKGRAGKATISYDGYVGTQRPLSGNVWHLMSPTQQSQLVFQAGDSGQETLYPGGPGVLPTYGYHGANNAGTFGNAGVTNDSGIEKYYFFDATNAANDFLVQKFNQQGTDWFHEIFKNAPVQSHSLSASGGNDKNTYLYSLQYYNDQGTLIESFEK
ncbi:MAG TPA: TonB-dependent receptor plug domain-containing protein, partial [Chitinophagaceae bacterium]|nr:TonB-dependent receptor plug domain-containing protein [Chitinophagaceae bacterium]